MTEGNPLKVIIAFSIPIMISGVVQQFYNIADTYIVGRYISDDALAAVGAVGPMNGLLIGFAMGITNGFSIPVAQAFGAGNRKMTEHYAGNAISLTFISSLIVTAISFAAMKPVLNLMGTPQNIFRDAYIYVIITYLGITVTTVYNVLSGILRALGDSKSPLNFLLASSVLNILLNYITIVFFHWGVAGAALSTVISQLASCVMCGIYIKKREDILHLAKEDFIIKKTTAVMMLKMGIPMSLQLSITSIGSMVLQTTINSYGSNIVAGFTVANKPERIANIPLSAIGVALATYAGQNFGAGRMDRVRQGVQKAMIFSGSISVVSSLLLYFLGEDMAKIFLDKNNIQALYAASTYLKVIAVFYLSLSALFIFRNALQGIGKSYVSMLAGIAELVGRIVCAAVLSKLIGFTGICLASPLAWILADIPLLIIYFLKVIRVKNKRGKLNFEKV